MINDLHECSVENAPKMLNWLKNRGGIAIWNSVDFGNLGASWSTPANNEDGTPTKKPMWQADSKPARIITDPKEVLVVHRKEVKRFHVAIRRGSQGMSFNLTDGSDRKLKAALAKFGKESSYHFDYCEQEAVITMPDAKWTLDSWSNIQEMLPGFVPAVCLNEEVCDG